VSLAFVVFGVALATMPPSCGKSSSLLYLANFSSIFVTLLGAFLASLKSVAASVLQKDKSPRRGSGKGSRWEGGQLGLSPIELIHYISPLALLQSVLYSCVAGELSQISLLFGFVKPGTGRGEAKEGFFVDGTLAIYLLLNCLVASSLNIASFEANRRVGALGITIAGNVKQIFIMVLEVVVAGQEWPWRSFLGVLATISGSCWFVIEEGQRKRLAEEAKVRDRGKEKEENVPGVLEEGGADG
jgi:drug/metabolite transporter (DMT)-like permease